MEVQHAPLNIASSGPGTASFDLSRFRRVTFQTAGVSSATMNLEATIDGTDWVAIKTGLSNGIVTLDQLLSGAGCVKLVRVNTASLGGDTPVVTLLAQSLGY